MKNVFRSAVPLFFLYFLQTIATAQPLQGVYTINSNSATAGTVFQSFTAFSASLALNGVAGPVTVNVAPATGPYTEQVTFQTATGVSAVNNIVINGNQNTITYASTLSAQPWVINLDGADHVTINDLNITGTGTYAYGILLHNKADHNSINRCVVTVPMSGLISHIPIVFSGTVTSQAGPGICGSYNAVTGCTVMNGAIGISMHCITTATSYPAGNRISGCTITDFGGTGIMASTMIDIEVTGNLLSRPTRTSSVGSVTGIYCVNYDNALIDGNRIRDMFPAMSQANTSFQGIEISYNIYPPSQVPAPRKSHVRNNIISHITNNGSNTGILFNAPLCDIYHNTITLDHTTASAGNTYGLAGNGSTVFPVSIINNIVTVTRGGSGTKYCFITNNPPGITADRNNFYINAAGGSSYIGFFTGNAVTLAQLQQQGIMATGMSADPVYANPAAYDFHPTNAALNNTAVPTGLVQDQSGAIRNQLAPDIGALEFLAPTCSSTPSAAVSGGHYTFCPGQTASLLLSNFSHSAGISYQWGTSSSSLGPFAAVPGATLPAFNSAPLSGTTFVNIIITCTPVSSSSYVATVTLATAGTTTSAPNYYEGFEAVQKKNWLPDCSWYSKDLGEAFITDTIVNTANRVPRTGSRYAYFQALKTSTNSVYSHGLMLHPGYTYSAAIWWQTDLTGGLNWQRLSMILSNSQNVAGHTTTLASVSPANSVGYIAMTQTFNVPAADSGTSALKRAQIKERPLIS